MYDNRLTRRLDARGRLVIPARLRRLFGIERGEVEVFTENDLICLRRFVPERRHKPERRVKGTSGCNYCICSSCTGFGCPWLPAFSRYSAAGGFHDRRCRICVTKLMAHIHDCDFYTARKRVKFFRPKRVKAESKHEILMRELREIRGVLTDLKFPT